MATIRIRLDSEDQMKRVTGIGGIFFSAKDPKALGAWYKTHLGIDVQDWGGAAFDWTDADGNPTKGTTAWSVEQLVTTSLQASRPSWSTIAWKTWQRSFKRFAMKAATCLRRPMTQSTGSSGGSWIRKATRLNFGNHRPGNNLRARRGKADA
jgi:hypothetical protein